ncbi:ORF6N domain-containing protein [Paenibacillus sp. Marseille-Q4541]|uniref:ORF6N domain-containing protein n=1 Tax=Paenibacillus sp. Marseille-Q4541 TaxID=2831522 RepID=UPI001BA506B4|nr:ORF6N domain-containing protein [Paenibacillus sp. Marseille-Q4541]
MYQLQVIEHNGQRVLTTAQLAESYGTDTKTISKNFERNESRYTEGKHFYMLKGMDLKEFKASRQNDDTLKFTSILYLWTEKGAWLTAKSLNTDKAWGAYEMLVDDYYFKTDFLNSNPQYQSMSSDDLLHFRKEAYMIEVSANVLRLPDSGRLKLLGDFNKQHGLSVPLPGYADEAITESASALLKKHGVGIQTQAFNQLLISQGILEEKERPSSKGGSKVFKSITDVGLEYGKNIISPASPRETAPHYFPNRFADLLKRVGLSS